MTPSERPISPPKSRSVAAAIVGRWLRIALWQRILAALLLGIIAGALLGKGAVEIKWIGDLFLRLLQMLVAPLVFVLIVSGVAATRDTRRLGSIGARAALLYGLLAAVAAVLGLALALLIQPGAGVSLAGAAKLHVGAAPPLGETLMKIVPTNPFQALANGDMLAILFFGGLLGVGVVLVGEKAAPVAALAESAAAVMLRLVQVVMELAPIGVFALIAWVVGVNGFSAFASIFKLGLCVVLGSAIDVLVVQGLLIRLGAGLPLLPFLRGVIDPAVVAFSTASKSAALPAAVRAARENLGLSPAIVSTVAPLGATIGVSGQAMYIACLAMFAAQAFGVTLSWVDYLTLLVTTTVIALGVPPVPSASLLVLAAVLSGIGLKPEQTALLVGFILPFDRPLDMVRTIPSLCSTLSVATAVARWEGEIDVAAYNAAADV